MRKKIIIIPNLQWRKLNFKEIKILKEFKEIKGNLRNLRKLKILMLYTKNDILVFSTDFHFPDMLRVYDKDPFRFFFKTSSTPEK